MYRKVVVLVCVAVICAFVVGRGHDRGWGFVDDRDLQTVRGGEICYWLEYQHCIVDNIDSCQNQSSCYPEGQDMLCGRLPAWMYFQPHYTVARENPTGMTEHTTNEPQPCICVKRCNDEPCQPIPGGLWVCREGGIAAYAHYLYPQSLQGYSCPTGS